MTKYATKIWDNERGGWFIAGFSSSYDYERAYCRCVSNNGHIASVINYRTLEEVWDD